MYLAFLTVMVKMSAEIRNYVPEQENEDTDEVKENMKKVIDLAVEGEG